MMAKEKPPITVVGDVGGRIAIIVVRFYNMSRLYDALRMLQLGKKNKISTDLKQSACLTASVMLIFSTFE